VDNYNGPSGVIAGAGKGVFRTLYCKRSCIADMVPVDLCINLTCCLGWAASLTPSPSNEISGPGPSVYNFTSGASNPITWGEVEILGLVSLLKTPFQGILWYPGGSYKENKYLNKIFQLFYHYGPFALVDFACKVLGQKPFLMKINNMIIKSSKALEPFTTNSWTWDNGNVKSLAKQLTEEDKEKFGFDVRDIEWQGYLDVYVEGIREFLFKEDPSTIADSKKRLKVMYFLDIIVQTLFYLGVVYLLWKVLF